MGGTRSNDEVVTVEPAHIRFVNPMDESVKTPKLSDFLKATANRSEDDNYTIINPNLASNVPDEWISNGMDNEGYPLPFLMPRYGVPILPFMFPAFNPTFSTKVKLMCLIELSMRYAAKNLSVQASKDFFANCFPVFQAVWYWTTCQDDHTTSRITILEPDDDPVIATDPKVMKVARSIKLRWISDEVVVGINNAVSPVAAAPGVHYLHTTDPSVTKVLAQNCDIQAQMIQLLDEKVSGQGIKSWASRFHISKKRDSSRPIDYGTIDFTHEIRKIKSEESLNVVIPEVVKDIVKAAKSLKNGAEVAVANPKKPHFRRQTTIVSFLPKRKRNPKLSVQRRKGAE
jgi:hypothetical protein